MYGTNKIYDSRKQNIVNLTFQQNSVMEIQIHESVSCIMHIPLFYVFFEKIQVSMTFCTMNTETHKFGIHNQASVIE